MWKPIEEAPVDDGRITFDVGTVLRSASGEMILLGHDICGWMSVDGSCLDWGHTHQEMIKERKITHFCVLQLPDDAQGSTEGD